QLADPAVHGRETLISETMRPAATTDRWQSRFEDPGFADTADRAMAGVSVIEAANSEEEALAIAVCLREAVEIPGKTAALVTPDRRWARRVVAALDGWQVEVEDSGSDTLADTPAGIFARLVAETTLGGLEPASLLALLKHPLFRLGAEATAHAHAVAALECAVLRGPRPRRGSAGLLRTLARFKRTQRELHHNHPRSFLLSGGPSTARPLAG